MKKYIVIVILLMVTLGAQAQDGKSDKVDRNRNKIERIEAK